MAYENKCQTLKLICCVTCKKYFEEVAANKTAEAKLAAEAGNEAENNSEGGDGGGSTSIGISNSISISTSMGTAPSSESGAPSRTATVTGGEWADITTTSIEAAATEGMYGIYGILTRFTQFLS